MDSRTRKRFQTRLVRWFEVHQRPMPWRETNDPYRIWISETMLQQTQVATALEYYQRFVRKFPTLRHLAAAESATVMKAWEGLGYYSRARNLHAAAKEVVRSYGGKIPDAREDLLSLPGIGRYTAGAILSIAHGKREPVLDGNVIRVLSRVFRITENVRLAGTLDRLWRLAESLLPDAGVRAHNEALMELGATVCRPRQPACVECPVAGFCEAFRFSAQNELPVKTPKKPVPHVDVTAGIIWKKKHFLITLRPPRGMLGGLWEFPGGKVEPGEDLEACLAREIREELGVRIGIGPRLISVKHAYTHFRITLHVFECAYKGGSLRLRGCDDYRWISPEQLDRYAFPGADRKVIRLLRAKKTGGFS
jgi:A/G-specific adenine glycosylase